MLQENSKTKLAWLSSVILCLLCYHHLSFAQSKFKDVTSGAGIRHQFVVFEGFFGGGACVIDINKDGFEDLYLTGGMADDALYLNKGNGKFQNIFNTSGMDATTHYVTQGVVGADVNRDGWVDLFITTITSRDSVKRIPRAENLLFLNNGDQTFRDVTKKYKLDRLISFSTSGCFGDFNTDGFPDLYVCNYFQGYDGPLNVINDATIVNAEQTARGYLLKNIDGKYFSDVFDEYNLNYKGFAFGASFTDYDNDRDVDLFVNHDFGFKAQPNVLLKNEYPRKYFSDVAKATDMNLQLNAMGTGIGDVNNDGLLDYYVTNIRFNHFMVSQGNNKPFVDKARELGMGFVSISWGANLADFDHDTDLDLYVANGDLNPNCVPLADFYFENNNGSFADKAYLVGLNDYGIGRGSVSFDMDNDGDLDILVVNQKPVLNYPLESYTRIYRNDSTSGNWIKIALKGVDSELNGIGSRIELVVGKKKMIREIDGGSSIFSQNSTIAHFGLGDAAKIDSIIVTWVGKGKQVIINQDVNRLITITEIPSKKGLPLWMVFGIVAASVLFVAISYRFIKRNQ